MSRVSWKSGYLILIALMAVSSLQLWQSFNLSRIAAQVPQLIIVGTLLLLCIQLTLEFVKRDHRSPCDPSANEARSLKRITLGVFWISLLVSSTWLLGLIIGPAVFALVFLRWSANESWLLSFGYSIAMVFFVGFVFLVLLKSSFYPGILFGLFR